MENKKRKLEEARIGKTGNKIMKRARTGKWVVTAMLGLIVIGTTTVDVGAEQSGEQEVAVEESVAQDEGTVLTERVSWKANTVDQVTVEIDKQSNEKDQDPLKDYTIVWGDTLWAISLSTGTSVEELVALNNIVNPDLIYAGDVLLLADGTSIEVTPEHVSGTQGDSTQDVTKQETSKQDVTKQETSKQDVTKQETSKQETSKQGTSKQETDNKETSVTEGNGTNVSDNTQTGTGKDEGTVTEDDKDKGNFVGEKSKDEKDKGVDEGNKGGDVDLEPEVPEEPKPVEPKPVEPKPVEPKPVEPKPVEPKPVEPKPVEPKPEEPKPEEPKPVEPKPVEPKPVEPKPEEPETPVSPTLPPLEREVGYTEKGNINNHENVDPNDAYGHLYQEEYVIPYETEYVENPLLEEGQENVLLEGVNGTERHVYDVTILGGGDYQRTLVDKFMRQNPTNRILVVRQAP